MADVKNKEWSKSRLKTEVKSTITKTLEGILDFGEVAVGDKERFRVFRSKVLKLCNDAIRHIHKELDDGYEVEYTDLKEDIVQVRTQSYRRKD